MEWEPVEADLRGVGTAADLLAVGALSQEGAFGAEFAVDLRSAVGENSLAVSGI